MVVVVDDVVINNFWEVLRNNDNYVMEREREREREREKVKC